MRNKRYFRSIIICIFSILLCIPFTGCGTTQTGEQEETAEMIPVLAYHKIKPWDKNDEATTLEMFDTTFEEEMDYLKDNGFTTLTLDEFYQWYMGEIEAPKKSVLITFDDGYYGTYYYAYPVIKKK